MKQVRLQRTRQHKLVSPNGLPIVYVGRSPSGKQRLWANPYSIKKVGGREKSIQFFESYLRTLKKAGVPIIEQIKFELKGKNLACWCPLDQKCHADILLEIANN